MPDVVTFGEAMVRLVPPAQRRLEQATSLEVSVGGAELNVASGVSRLGLKSRWVSALPDNALGRMIRNKAREFGVDTSCVAWSPTGRAGLYFVEYGASPRASSVLYDRSHSVMSDLSGIGFDWPSLLAGARALHTSGITTALGERAAAEVCASLASARSLGIMTSYDLNYRARLWSTAQARNLQEPLMKHVDVLITTEEDAELVFGVTGTDHADVARRLADRFGNRIVTITLRGDLSVLRNTWTAIAYADGKIYDDRTYDLELVDRVGGGDAYAAGFLYGLLTHDVGTAVRFGNAFGALKQTSWGDLPFTTLGEVEAQLEGDRLRIAR